MRPRRKQVTVRLSTSLASVVLVAGCASTKEAVLPQDGPSMKAMRMPGRIVSGSRVNLTPFAFRSAQTASMPFTDRPK